MGVNFRRLIYEVINKKVKITWSIYLLVCLLTDNKTTENRARKLDNTLSKNNKNLIILGLIGVAIFGSIFYYFNSLNIKYVELIGIFNF